MKLFALALLAASAAAQTVGGVDLGKYDKCLTGCLDQMAKSVSCTLEKPECYCGTNNLNIATSSYALCISKECKDLDSQVMASGVYGQICSNVAMGGITNNQGISSAGAAAPSGDASKAPTPAPSASGSGAAPAGSASHAAGSHSGAAASASASAKPSSGATQLGASVLAVGGALAAFLA